MDIDPLNDAELLKCLENRYNSDEIYCYCGPTLIAINPYKEIDHFFVEKYFNMFREYALFGGKQISYPHIWNLASRSFYQLFDNDENQAICISGESGAGKSYGTRKCLGFITGLFKEGENPEGEDKKSVSMEDKIMGCNVILEAFGNAKTVMNNDSSRFGKYFVLKVDKQDKRIKGAEIKSYLLEKSRVNTQAVGERNYHVFYSVMAHMDEEKLIQYKFMDHFDKMDLGQFNYLKKSQCFTVKEVDDDEIFTKIHKSFNNLGFS